MIHNGLWQRRLDQRPRLVAEEVDEPRVRSPEIGGTRRVARVQLQNVDAGQSLKSKGRPVP